MATHGFAAAAISTVVLLCASYPLSAQDLSARTKLADVSVGGELSQMVQDISMGGYKTSGGEPVDFSHWYSSGWRNLSVTWLTALDRHTGIYWGFGTGEAGEKYHIDPAIRLGILFQRPLGNDRSLSLSAFTILGGALSERTCIADYGAIGGIQEVNCRLAASPLPPAATLNKMLDRPPLAENRISVTFTQRF